MHALFALGNGASRHATASVCRLLRCQRPRRVTVAAAPGIKEQTAQLDAPPQVGQLVTGTVYEVKPNRALVELLNGPPGTLHLADMSHEHVLRMPDHFSAGDQLTAVVVHREWHNTNKRAQDAPGDGGEDGDGGRGFWVLKVSTRVLEPTPGDMMRARKFVYERAAQTLAERQQAGGVARASRGPLPSPEVWDNLKPFTVVRGTVRSVQPSGVVVTITHPVQDSNLLAVLPVRNISREYVANAASVFSEGEDVCALLTKTEQWRGTVVLSTAALEVNAGDIIKDARAVFAGAEQRGASLQKLALTVWEVLGGRPDSASLRGEELGLPGVRRMMDWLQAQRPEALDGERLPAPGDKVIAEEMAELVLRAHHRLKALAAPC